MENKINYNEVNSPCQNKCMLDVDATYCVVCMRTLSEKKNWWRFSQSEKIKIIDDLKKRQHN